MPKSTLVDLKVTPSTLAGDPMPHVDLLDATTEAEQPPTRKSSTTASLLEFAYKRSKPE